MKPKKSNNLESLGNLVFSTHPDRVPQHEPEEEAEEVNPSSMLLYIGRQSKHRAGKTVTLVTGFTGSEPAFQELARTLKNRCGTGGSAKDGEIILQGDCREKVKEFLDSIGYKTKMK